MARMFHELPSRDRSEGHHIRRLSRHFVQDPGSGYVDTPRGP